jgi:hypothetical protein
VRPAASARGFKKDNDMPRESEIHHTQGGQTRVYHVVYADDPPERAEAVAFFGRLGGHSGLFPRMDVPEVVRTLPIEDANALLRRNPMPERFSGLFVEGGTLIRDEDLRRLEYLPELERVHLRADSITDAGVRHLRYLPQIKSLILYSAGVTNACLDVLRTLRTLRQLDLQGSTRLSRKKCAAVTRELVGCECWLP